MKKYNYLWMMACIFFCQAVHAQPVPNNIAAPSVKVKQALQSYGVALPFLKMPTIISSQKKGDVSAKNMAIAKIMEMGKRNMEIAKQQCPYLRFTPTLELEGERMDNEKVGLKWETTNGFDNWSFDVTRSLGDTMHFEKINFVWADERVSIKNKYRLPDNNDYDEVSYYRLKLLLNDGTFLYSNTVAVKGYDKFLFSIYPNPASHKLRINLSSKEEGNAGITVYDASGKMVQQQSASVTKGNDLKEIDVSGLSAGSYMVKMILPDNQVRTAKFVKN